MNRSEVYLFGFAYPTYWCTYCKLHEAEARARRNTILDYAECLICYVPKQIKNDRWMRIK